MMLSGHLELSSNCRTFLQQKGWCAMKRRRITTLAVSLAVVVSAMLIFVEPASGGVRFGVSIGGRSGHRSGHGSYRHGRSYHHGRSYGGYHRGGYYRHGSHYRGPIMTRSYTNYYSYPSVSYYGSYSSYPSTTYYSSSNCNTCGHTTCNCGHQSTTYYVPSRTTYYRSYSSGRCGSGTVVKYIIVR